MLPHTIKPLCKRPFRFVLLAMSGVVAISIGAGCASEQSSEPTSSSSRQGSAAVERALQQLNAQGVKLSSSTIAKVKSQVAAKLAHIDALRVAQAGTTQTPIYPTYPTVEATPTGSMPDVSQLSENIGEVGGGHSTGGTLTPPGRTGGSLTVQGRTGGTLVRGQSQSLSGGSAPTLTPAGGGFGGLNCNSNGTVNAITFSSDDEDIDWLSFWAQNGIACVSPGSLPTLSWEDLDSGSSTFNVFALVLSVTQVSATSAEAQLDIWETTVEGRSVVYDGPAIEAGSISVFIAIVAPADPQSAGEEIGFMIALVRS